MDLMWYTYLPISAYDVSTDVFNEDKMETSCLFFISRKEKDV